MALCLEDAWFKYDKYVLKGASICVEEGELAILLGPMGSGKSTLLYALANLIPLEKGRVTIDGKEFGEEDRRKVGIVFQDPEDQFFNATVFDEIAYSLRALGFEESVVRERVEAIASELGIERLLSKNPFKLSYGQKKLVALASVMVYEPNYLLADEPTSNLDKFSYEKVMELITKKGALVATHEVEWIPLASKVYIVNDGKVQEIGDIAQALKENKLPVPIPTSWEILFETLGFERALELLRERAYKAIAIRTQAKPPRRPAGGLR